MENRLCGSYVCFLQILQISVPDNPLPNWRFGHEKSLCIGLDEIFWSRHSVVLDNCFATRILRSVFLHFLQIFLLATFDPTQV